MWPQAKLFLLALVLVPVCDYLWLGRVMQGFYVREMQEVGRFTDGRFDPQLGPALAVYVLLALAIVCFVLPTAADGLQALLRGGFLGLIIYGVYDMTNMSVLRSYGLKLSLVDMAWGTVLCGSISALLFILRAKEIL